VTDGARTVETTWDPNRRDLSRAIRLTLGTGTYYLFGVAVLVIGLPGPLLLMTARGTLGPLLGVASAAVVLYLGLSNALYPHIAGRSFWKTNPLLRATEHLRIDATGVTSTSDLATLHLTWDALKAALETERFFALATRWGPGTTVVCFPKSGLTSDELDVARALITENVKPTG
jgi:hypothetical protein